MSENRWKLLIKKSALSNAVVLGPSFVILHKLMHGKSALIANVMPLVLTSINPSKVMS